MVSAARALYNIYEFEAPAVWKLVQHTIYMCISLTGRMCEIYWVIEWSLPPLSLSLFPVCLSLFTGHALLTLLCHVY